MGKHVRIDHYRHTREIIISRPDGSSVDIYVPRGLTPDEALRRQDVRRTTPWEHDDYSDIWTSYGYPMEV